jgi:hypothetical protein
MPQPKLSGTVKRGSGALHLGDSRLGTYCGKEWAVGQPQPFKGTLIHGLGNCRYCVDFASGKTMPGPQGLRDLFRLGR